MTLIILTGPQAVGKMTVGQQLETLTDLTLFHNHMTIDLVDNTHRSAEQVAQQVKSHFKL